MQDSGNVVIVDRSNSMRSSLKVLISNRQCDVYEARDESSALEQVSAHHPKVIFISMEYSDWPGLVRELKKHDCTVVAYCNRITRDALASAYFAGVDDILVNPLKQRERVEKLLFRMLRRGLV